MRVTLLQTDIRWADQLANVQHAGALIDSNPGSDLYVFPEMFSTGFATSPNGIAEESANDRDECSTLDWMVSTAKSKKVAIAGSVALHCSDGTFRNRLFFVKPSGEYTYYDKHHLFTYGGEDRMFTSGNERVVVEYMGIRFLLQVCYDLRFPVWSRNHADYDAIIYVASWPTSRIEAWSTLLKARAIENQCYVVGVNRVGTDPACSYCGWTSFVDPYGRASVCEGEEEASLTSVIDIPRLEEFRKKFPVLQDRDI